MGSESIQLVGVDDYWEKSYDLVRALQDSPEGSLRVLLSHNPDVNEDIEVYANKLTWSSPVTPRRSDRSPLSGYALFAIPFWAEIPLRARTDGDRYTYVSRGLGCFLPQSASTAPRGHCSYAACKASRGSEKDLE